MALRPGTGRRGSDQPRLTPFSWRGIVQLGRWIRALKAAGCRDVIMVGRVKKATMFAGPRWLQWLRYVPDLTSRRDWYCGARDTRNASLLRALADELERNGLTLIDSTRYIPEALAEEGLLTAGGPRPAAEAPRRVLDDAEFAWPIARQIAGLDVGQAVVVKEREIIAVEAIEGTDKLIERAAQLCPAGGWTLVKLAKPAQDMRFDVPTIGLLTIQNMKAAGATCLAVEAGKVILLDKQQVIEAADKAGIAVVGVKVE